MNKRMGVIAIIVKDRKSSSSKVNEILTEYGEMIIGRMGVPYREKKVNVISLIVEANTDQIGALTGKLGMIPQVEVKSILITK
ncbi:iron-only hydrogenase system regulator [Desulfohalobiaceae bacterium Ax17]|uniref:TM1266 family iron-only hydrogenase system putative regulator n=1 Tax=Desulfovulcanus ferrireducens TaxID=2831190 RepID=UPI00207BC32C|nr:TM1266 family iron-only hydrogenase system putative regulator [Desulfovulcanus ferrireducens]MBT8764113.1 iron-only hydrogenase system regulator [Desulfovulcanus ferrireducens]